MRISRISFALSALIAGAIALSGATVPPELAVIGDPSTVLNATFSVGSTGFTFHPAEFLNASTAKNVPQPHLHNLGLAANGSYVFMMVDPDWNKTTPPSVILHTLIANLTTNLNSTSNEDVIAQYISPDPTSGTHNYTLFLFDQPSNFTIPSQYGSFMETTDETPLNRLNLPLENFINVTRLGTPVAANYFRVTATTVSNDTSTSTSTSTPSPTSNSTAASTSSSGGGIRIAGNPNCYVTSALALLGAALAVV
ncbi:PEBP-like protein [Penicillium angulare]|uniref:PEBP-like protein n=1 Tax=Penicillium angulare TaxID=116970 RepID=UPI0025402002|nr:PEBP-like protein [Penicillium angulare]KAJ5280912.1 PEBP-like protein [Penicillium angulare]